MDAIFKALSWSFNVLATGNVPKYDWDSRPIDVDDAYLAAAHGAQSGLRLFRHGEVPILVHGDKRDRLIRHRRDSLLGERQVDIRTGLLVPHWFAVLGDWNGSIHSSASRERQTFLCCCGILPTRVPMA